LLIFRKAAAGELIEGSGLSELARLSEVDISDVGVKGAKDFFEAKVNELTQGKGPFPLKKVISTDRTFSENIIVLKVENFQLQNLFPTENLY
jgi:hypothetical protein